MNPVKIFLKSGAWLTLAGILSKLANAFSLPLLARFLTPESLGIYNIITALVQSTNGFSNLGITIAMERNGSQYKTLGVEAVGRLFGVGLTLICIVNTTIAIGIYLFRQPLAHNWLGQNNIAYWIGVSALLISLQPLGNVPLIFLASLQDFRAYAIRSSLGAISSSAISIILSWQFGIDGAIFGLILAAALQILWSYAIVKLVLKNKEIRLRLDQFWQESRSIFKLGFPYYCGNTLLGSLVGLPLMGLVSQYGGLKELGYLRVAQSLAALIGFIPAAIAPAAISYLSANLVDDPTSYQRIKSIYLRGNWILLLVPTGIISLMIPDLINLVFGQGYQQAGFLAWLTMWLSMMAGATSILIQYLVVSGKTSQVAWSSFFGVCCWVISAFLLIPRYSGTGFLIAQSIGQIVGFTLVVKPAIYDLNSKDMKLFSNLIYLTSLTFVWTLGIILLKVIPVVNGFIIVLTALSLVSVIFKVGLQDSEQKELTDFFDKLRVSI